MKTATCLTALWCVTIGGFAQESPKVQPAPLFDDLSTGRSPDDESLAARHREAIEKARVEEQRGMEAVVFSEECVTVSEPADRLLFTHEVNVVAFIATRGKFGFDRVSTIHMSNPRLETHGGVAFGPVLSLGKWQEKGRQYELTRPWGMIGDIDQSKPKAYLFRPSPYLKRRTAGSNTEKSPKVEAYDLSRFEEYALTMLNKGEKLVRWERADAMHAVGAVRAETQCLRCHEGSKPGDLLGAFTYSFAKTKAAQLDDKTAQILKLHDEHKTTLEIAEAVGFLKPFADADILPAKVVASYQVQLALLSQGIVTAEMLAEQAQIRKDLLNSDLGPVKKPRAAAGAE